jgi:hypothetical protein
LILVLLLADLLTITLASERFFYALFFARLQIKGMTLYFLDDVFGLHLSLETAQSILKGFAFLNSNLCQEKHLQTFPTGTYMRILRFSRERMLMVEKLLGFLAYPSPWGIEGP